MCIETNVIKLLEAQFLCCHNLSLINISEILRDVTWEKQKLVLDSTIDSQLNCEKPVRIQYQISFLKKLIKYLESNGCDIHDNIYEKFCELQSAIPEKCFSFKHYVLPNSTVISLKESKNFVLNGTTGLCTWQASLVLSNWILNNTEIFTKKNILELGCGTGLCGLTVTKCCKFDKILLSDGSHEVIDLLNENVNNNFPNLQILNKDGAFSLKLNDFQELVSVVLPWESISESKLKGILIPDIILAADVVYDNLVFSALVNAFEFLTRLNENCLIILACTVRNENTLKEFLNILDQYEYLINKQHYDLTEPKYFVWDDSTPINIYYINKKK